MLALYLLFYLVALVIFIIAALGVSVRNLNLLALGLFFWTLPPFLQMWTRLT